jgi:hypothetical protein
VCQSVWNLSGRFIIDKREKEFSPTNQSVIRSVSFSFKSRLVVLFWRFLERLINPIIVDLLPVSISIFMDSFVVLVVHLAIFTADQRDIPMGNGRDEGNRDSMVIAFRLLCGREPRE